MRKKPAKKILTEIDDFFKLAKEESKQNPKIASQHVAKARKLAKRSNLSIKKYRKLFCKKCNSFFTSENSQIRIKKGMKTIKCLQCRAYRRFKIEK